MAKKTFNEKLNDSKNMPVVEDVSPEAAARRGGTRMLIAPPLAYDAIMKTVPAGKVITTDRMRAHLARKYGADWTCPLTCGIFCNIAAFASEERKGLDETPWWRTLKAGGELNEKFPGGTEAQKIRLETEGHKVFQKGKRYFAEDYQQKLFEL